LLQDDAEESQMTVRLPQFEPCEFTRCGTRKNLGWSAKKAPFMPTSRQAKTVAVEDELGPLILCRACAERVSGSPSLRRNSMEDQTITDKTAEKNLRAFREHAAKQNEAAATSPATGA
jgi:hypothetical protein